MTDSGSERWRLVEDLFHRALDQPPGSRPAFVKLVNHGLAAEISGARVDAERHILARLDHPNIARLIDAGLSDFGQPFIVMDWVDGVPLDLWRAQARPSLEAGLDLWLEIADAGAYAHRNLVVHRDLTPSNAGRGWNAQRDDAHAAFHSAVREPRAIAWSVGDDLNRHSRIGPAALRDRGR